MTLEEKLKEKSIPLMQKYMWIDQPTEMQKEQVILLKDALSICQQEIAEACKKQREEAIEECARLIENNAEKANDVLVEERHILAPDTVELFRNDIEFQRLIARKLRELKNAPSPKEDKKYYCKDCGTEMDEGEAKTFTCCEVCWDKHYKNQSPKESE